MKKRRGAAFKPKKAQRDKVMLLVSAGMSEDGISSAIGIDRKMLRKHFIYELLNGHALKRAENMARLEKAAKAGNVTAMKYLDAKQGIVPEKDIKTPPLGKKETLEMEAKTGHVETGWGDVLQ